MKSLHHILRKIFFFVSHVYLILYIIVTLTARLSGHELTPEQQIYWMHRAIVALMIIMYDSYLSGRQTHH